MRWIFWLVIALPIVVWSSSHLYHEIWWVENITALSGLFLCYFALVALVAFAARYWAHFIVSICSAMVFLMMAEPAQSLEVAHCDTPVSVEQFSLTQSALTSDVIDQLLNRRVDLLIVQNVPSQQAIADDHRLLAIYPYRYQSSSQSTGNSQWLLSRFMLSNISEFPIGYGYFGLKATWHPIPQKQILLVAATLPSPLDQASWSLRNALLRTIESQVFVNNDDEMIVVGNFNVAAKTMRFSRLFPGFESAPVVSWPTQLGRFQTPYFMMLSLDHLWLKSLQSGRRICSRAAEPSLSGNLHNMVKTVIGY